MSTLFSPSKKKEVSAGKKKSIGRRKRWQISCVPFLAALCIER